MTDEERTYLVRRSGHHAAHVVRAENPQAAALAWLEITDAEYGELRIVVRPHDGHDEHCFVLDAATGEASGC
ncbi:DUF5961 family protein [Caulobacter segnis]|uniref:DUF5961 family protein n=1 Tax=Caulobacter segnis TaxID=88688 RepID=UPI002410A499|nr:DUF5961 family protein [Caulobacter segnis]MDG2520630.1 DUF5961 family protein [Caulobacter segnis]